jgi:hypothetical protein
MQGPVLNRNWVGGRCVPFWEEPTVCTSGLLARLAWAECCFKRELTSLVSRDRHLHLNFETTTHLNMLLQLMCFALVLPALKSEVIQPLQDGIIVEKGNELRRGKRDYGPYSSHSKTPFLHTDPENLQIYTIWSARYDVALTILTTGQTN